jgi:hypothetical protein
LADWTDRAIDGEVHQGACKQRRLDDLVREEEIAMPDFIKCDVEGAELLVFRGGRRVLDRPDGPIVLFEVNVHTVQGFGFAISDAKEFLETLRSPRYRFFEVRSDGTLPRLGALTQSPNVLAIPESKLSRFPELQ